MQPNPSAPKIPAIARIKNAAAQCDNEDSELRRREDSASPESWKATGDLLRAWAGNLRYWETLDNGQGRIPHGQIMKAFDTVVKEQERAARTQMETGTQPAPRPNTCILSTLVQDVTGYMGPEAAEAVRQSFARAVSELDMETQQEKPPGRIIRCLQRMLRPDVVGGFLDHDLPERVYAAPQPRINGISRKKISKNERG